MPTALTGPRSRVLTPGAGEDKRWLSEPANAVISLIVLTAILRLIFAGMLGLGPDESYMVAGSRQLQLSYFDHPPLSWWLTWGAMQLFGSEADIIVRLPFIVLFGLTTWLMFKLGETLSSPRAGLWGAVTLNLAPVLGITTATWVLPDGPLDCALLGLMYCLARALELQSWRWWLGVGLCGGLALLSKYTAVFTGAGIGLYLLTQPTHRRWLLRPQPYFAGLIAAVLFSPVLIWNAHHGWMSFLFQGGRAGGNQLHLLAPITALGGEALFLLPWVWVSLMIVLASAVLRGPASRHEWLLCCTGAMPIIAFSVIAIWSRDPVLSHWAANGYLMLFPLLGARVAVELDRGDWLTESWLAGTVFIILATLCIATSDVRWNWLPKIGVRFSIDRDPALGVIDWTSLKTQLLRLKKPGIAAFAATRWADAGKLDYALDGAAPVFCLGADPREFGIEHNASLYAGRDVLIVAPERTDAYVRGFFGSNFASIEPLPPLVLLHAGRAAMILPLYIGRGMRVSPSNAGIIATSDGVRANSRSPISPR